MFNYLWGGKKPDNAKPENENPELAMRDQLDEHGEFACKIDGTLEYPDFLVLRAVIMRQSLRMFKPKRDELNARKLEAFKAKNQAEYVKIFREGKSAYTTCVNTISKKACEWIELEENNFNLSTKTYMEDQEKVKEIMQKDSEAKAAVE